MNEAQTEAVEKELARYQKAWLDAQDQVNRAQAQKIKAQALVDAYAEKIAELEDIE